MKTLKVGKYEFSEEDLRDLASLSPGARDGECAIAESVHHMFGIDLTLAQATRLLNAIDNLPAPKPDKVKLALAAYESAIVGAESFEEEHLGADLAYLMAAILKDEQCEWPENRAIVQVLKLRLTKINREAIFKHIKITKD